MCSRQEPSYTDPTRLINMISHLHRADHKSSGMNISDLLLHVVVVDRKKDIWNVQCVAKTEASILCHL